jgi:hypothetical protein
VKADKQLEHGVRTVFNAVTIDVHEAPFHRDRERRRCVRDPPRRLVYVRASRTTRAQYSINALSIFMKGSRRRAEDVYVVEAVLLPEI